MIVTDLDIEVAIFSIEEAEENGSGDTWTDEFGDEMHPDFMDE